MTTTRRTPHLAVTAIAALALAGCGSSSSSSSSAPAASTPAPAAQGGAGAYGGAGASGASAAGAVKVSADPGGALRFTVSTLHAQAGSVTLEMVNPATSHSPHGIAVQGNGVDKDSKIVKSGATTTVTATLKPGTYSFYCPVPGHEAAGMKGTLIVT